MEKSQEPYSISKDTFDKIESILNHNIKEQTPTDLIFIYELKVFFSLKDDRYEFIFNTDNHLGKIISKIVDLLYIAFKLTKVDRDNLYNRDILDIHKDLRFKDIINDLELLQSFDIDFKNREKIQKLFEVISLALDLKKKYSFSEYIDSIFFNLSFLPGLDPLLKFQLFSLIIKYYLEPLHVILDFNDKAINISDNISLDLLLDLFTNNQDDFSSLIKSIIFLNYGTIIDIIKNYNYTEIICGIERVRLKMKNDENMSLCVEKILTIFCDELRRPKYEKSKKKKRNKSKRVNKKEDLQKKEIILNSKISDNNVGKITNEIIEIKNEKNIKNGNIDVNVFSNQIESINTYFNNLRNYINKNNMGNENVKNDMENLHNLMLNIVKDNKKLKDDNEKIIDNNEKIIDDNKKMKGKIEEMNNKILILNKENQIQNKDIEDLKERLTELGKGYQEVKDILGSIQCRDLSKNFLRAFGVYLTDNDWNLIRNNKNKRGEIISKRIEKLYPKADKKKMNLIQKLVEKSADLIQDGNYLAHSVTLEEYEEEINAYKEEKNLKEVASPLAICFLFSLGISNELFDNAYAFLNQYFNFYLKTNKGNRLLDLYFN